MLLCCRKGYSCYCIMNLPYVVFFIKKHPAGKSSILDIYSFLDSIELQETYVVSNQEDLYNIRNTSGYLFILTVVRLDHSR